MNCACISGEGADVMTKELRAQHQRARKHHLCGECREPIVMGSTYEKFVGVEDGKLVTYRTCSLCVEIREHFSDNQGWLWGSVWEDIQECFPTLTAGGPCMDGLSAAAKAKLFERWRRWKGIEMLRRRLSVPEIETEEKGGDI